MRSGVVPGVKNCSQSIPENQQPRLFLSRRKGEKKLILSGKGLPQNLETRATRREDQLLKNPGTPLATRNLEFFPSGFFPHICNEQLPLWCPPLNRLAFRTPWGNACSKGMGNENLRRRRRH
jgi:hypothetical protein